MTENAFAEDMPVRLHAYIQVIVIQLEASIGLCRIAGFAPVLCLSYDPAVIRWLSTAAMI